MTTVSEDLTFLLYMVLKNELLLLFHQLRLGYCAICKLIICSFFTHCKLVFNNVLINNSR